MVTQIPAAPIETTQPDISPYLAAAVDRQLADAAEGHCIRVNHLTRDQALAVIRRLMPMSADRATRLTAKVLGDGETDGKPMTVRTDQAIELRNRKHGVGIFCLFVPAGAHNTTASSLGNSFAEIDGAELMDDALAIFLRHPDTPDAVTRTVGSIRGIFAQTTAASRPAGSDLLAFAVAAAEQLASDPEAPIGLGLWRVGLIPDRGPDFAARLRRNRTVVAALARPAKMTAQLDERVNGLKLLPDSAKQIKASLAGQPLHAVKQWTRQLAASDHATFDRWEFADEPVVSDCREVRIKPFLDERGARIEANAKGLAQEFAGAPLLAQIGEKQKLTVKWETTPPKTTVARWQVEIVPADERDAWDDAAIELPTTEIKKPNARTANLNLNLPFVDDDDLPHMPFRVRVRAIAETGEEIVGPDEQVLEALSEEFYLTRGRDAGPGPATKERGNTAGTLPEGVLRVLVTRGGSAHSVGAPQWHPGPLVTRFTLKVTERDLVSVLLSTVLLELQERVLAAPNALGTWSLILDDQETPTITSFSPSASSIFGSDAEKRFLQARKSFFAKITVGEEGRNRVEVADWTPQLTASARAYANAWAEWLDAASGDELRTALGVDSLRVVIGDPRSPIVDALVALPTHPLRSLWFASQSLLFSGWAASLEPIDAKRRAAEIDLDMVAGVLPTNVPPLLHHPDAAAPYAFFRNLDAGHGVGFSSRCANPAAQFAILGALLGSSGSLGVGDAVQEGRTAVALQRFHESHPYADPLKLALVNPDDGSFLAQALNRWEDTLYQAGQTAKAAASAGMATDDIDRAPLELPGLHITAYVQDATTSISTALDQRRREREERVTAVPSDHLRPSLSIIERPRETLHGPDADQIAHHHHLAVIQDLAEPIPATFLGALPDDGTVGLALHGLVVRYSNRIERAHNEILIRYWIDLDAPVTPHPVERSLSESTLKTHRAASSAAARLLDARLAPEQSPRVGLAVRLTAAELELIRRIHANTDWVITVDRFIGPELFDLPDGTTSEGRPVRTYILDAAPDFQDGVSRRSFVTTSSRDEVEAILLRAMGRFGFPRLHESVGTLVHTLRTVSGRLVLDALRSDSRAAEVVGIGAVVAWLKAKNQLGDALIVPIDPHLEVFQPASKQAGKTFQRCDLALFRFTSTSKIKLTLIEVKSRSTLAGSLDDLLTTMTQQMGATGATVEDRCANGERIDRTLQRSVLAQVLRFYLDRAVRFGLIDGATRATFAKRIAGLERAALDIESDYRGFIIALDGAEQPRTIRVDEETRIEVLTVPEIARVTAAMPVAIPPKQPTVENFSPQPDPLPAKHEPSSSDAPVVTANIIDGGANQPFDPLTNEVAPSLNQVDHTVPPKMSQDVILGTVSGDPVIWKPRVAGSPHLFILGIPGQGKTVTTERLLTELAVAGTPALVLDFHGTFADPNGRYARQANPVLIDAAQGLPFSPFAIDPRSSQMEIAQHAREIMNVVDHVFDLGPIQGDVFYKSLHRLYLQRGFGDVDDDQPDPEPPTLTALLRALERMEKDQGVKNLVARTRVLFEFDLFKPLADNPQRFDDLLRQGLVIALNRLGGDELPLALSGFLLRQIYLSMTKWPVADRVRLAIVLDEAHRLARDVTLPKLMKEGRKYGVAIVIASQGLADFHPDVVGNAGTKISFRMNHPESRKVAQFFRAQPGQDLTAVLEGLGVGHALVQTPEMPRALRATMLPAS